MLPPRHLGKEEREVNSAIEVLLRKEFASEISMKFIHYRYCKRDKGLKGPIHVNTKLLG